MAALVESAEPALAAQEAIPALLAAAGVALKLPAELPATAVAARQPARPWLVQVVDTLTARLLPAEPTAAELVAEGLVQLRVDREEAAAEPGISAVAAAARQPERP
jgi:hypothetical protein